MLSEGYREYADRAFISALGRADLAEELGEFWPRGGPVWDGLATFRTADGQQGALLVEAKAHAGELLRGGTLGKSVSADSRRTIQRSLAAARTKLGAQADEADWTVDRYQSANRLAHTLWLGEHMPTVLAQVLFHDDPTHRSESKSTLEDAAADVYQGLGFTGAPPAFAITVLCPGADPLNLSPSTLPTWAREPVGPDGLDVTRQSYPPEVRHRTRSESPVWALVGVRGWENDEIAVAAFPHGLEFAILTHWWDSHDPVTAVIPVQRVAWGEFPPDRTAALAAVRLLARAAAMRRRQSYRTCADCDEHVAPEGRDRIAGRYVCHDCQERHHGIAH